MSGMTITVPLAATLGGTFEDVQRLKTPAPREAAITAGGTRTIDIDMGTVQPFDTIFIGYTNAADTALFSATYGEAAYAAAALPDILAAPSRLTVTARHFLASYAAPVTGRYIRLTGAGLPAGFAIGALAVGLAFRPSLGHEYGAGRFVTDTGSVTRLFGGGFGSSPGARPGGWQWTLGDLTDAEHDTLYALQRLVGTTETVLVTEDPARTAGQNERLHWGLLSRLEPSDRRDPDLIKWSMRIEDWL